MEEESGTVYMVRLLLLWDDATLFVIFRYYCVLVEVCVGTKKKEERLLEVMRVRCCNTLSTGF